MGIVRADINLIIMGICTELIRRKCELKENEITHVINRYPVDEWSPEFAAYYDGYSKGIRRRGRPRKRPSTKEIYEAVDMLVDYHLFKAEEAERQASCPARARRSGLLMEEAPAERALERVKQKHQLTPSLRTIENFLSKWRKNTVVRRLVFRKLTDQVQRSEEE